MSGFVLLAAILVLSQTGGSQTPQGAGGGGTITAGGPAFQVLRSLAGTSGAESNGRFIMDDPRTTFRLGQDQKIIVYFEWAGPIGPHRFEGLWKNTEGKVVLISEFQFAATAQQFSGYWTMLLSGSEMPGVWTLDARIDGESAGSYSFQLVAGPGAEPLSRAPVRQPLSGADLYKRSLEATVYIDKLDVSGKAVSRGSGFYLDSGALVTAFQNIDGASKVRVILPDGRAMDVSQLRTWNRWQDWAVLAAAPQGIQGLPRAQTKSWSVGTIAYYLETSTASSRIILDTTVVGENTFPRAGDRLNLSGSPARTAVGSPLVNEYGEAIGMMGGSLAPGTDLLQSYLLTTNAAGGATGIRDGLALPIALIPLSFDGSSTSALGDLARTGEMIPLLTGNEKVAYGQFSTSLKKDLGSIFPENGRQQFSHQDQKFYVYLSWASDVSFKGESTMAIYDADNRLIGRSKPLKLNLRRGNSTSSNWDVPLMSFTAGFYRVDVALGTDIVWRRFFRITD